MNRKNKQNHWEGQYSSSYKRGVKGAEGGKWVKRGPICGDIKEFIKNKIKMVDAEELYSEHTRELLAFYHKPFSTIYI